MATANATRTYPGQVIPADPTASTFESDFRTNTETLMTATKDVDDEISLARGSTTATYANLKARLDYIESTTGLSASFWQSQSGFTAVAGNSFLTVTGDATGIYIANRPIRITGSSGIVYGYVSSSSFSTLTTVNLVSDNAGTALTITGTVSAVAYASQQAEVLWLYNAANLSASALNTINGTSVAMAIALG
jgi:hypothetical protein